MKYTRLMAAMAISLFLLTLATVACSPEQGPIAGKDAIGYQWPIPAGVDYTSSGGPVPGCKDAVADSGIARMAEDCSAVIDGSIVLEVAICDGRG